MWNNLKELLQTELKILVRFIEGYTAFQHAILLRDVEGISAILNERDTLLAEAMYYHRMIKTSKDLFTPESKDLQAQVDLHLAQIKDQEILIGQSLARVYEDVHSDSINFRDQKKTPQIAYEHKMPWKTIKTKRFHVSSFFTKEEMFGFRSQQSL